TFASGFLKCAIAVRGFLHRIGEGREDRHGFLLGGYSRWQQLVRVQPDGEEAAPSIAGSPRATSTNKEADGSSVASSSRNRLSLAVFRVRPLPAWFRTVIGCEFG